MQKTDQNLFCGMLIILGFTVQFTLCPILMLLPYKQEKTTLKLHLALYVLENLVFFKKNSVNKHFKKLSL